MSSYIAKAFPINNEEYKNLEKSFGYLAKYASWQLIRKNAKNNHTDDFEDINQDLIMALIRAGSYYKRQLYIEKCFIVAKEYVFDQFIAKLLDGLEDLWFRRTRHGANRQKFGIIQEKILYKIVRNYVPLSERPKKDTPLEIDKRFSTYCKAIAWNEQKSLGRKITKEKGLRTGMCSLSDYDYLARDTI